jgi:hypothetical protein
MPHRWTSRAALAATLLLSLAACAPDHLASPTARPAPAQAVASTTPLAVPSPDGGGGINTLVDRFAYALQPYNAAFPWGQTWTSMAGYYYNSSGGAITFTRLGQGSYSVNFEGLSRPGITLDNPSGYGSETVLATTVLTGVPGLTCRAVSWFSWGSVSRLTARVDCVDANGQYWDTPFNILVVGDGSLPAPSAFAIGDQPTALQYLPDPKWSYTSGPYTLRVGHNPFVGGWDWGMGTGAPAGKIHLVNSHTAQELCQIAEYKSLGPSVRCFDTEGVGRDVQYQVLQVSRGRPGRRFGFAWADQYTSRVPYSPHPSYVYNSSGGAVQVQRLSFGYYKVFFQGLNSPNPDQHENVQITGFGASYSACNTNGWETVNHPTLGTGLSVYVMCTNQNGQPTDSRFNLMVIE